MPKYIEMTEKQINENPFGSPHKQISEDFRAMVTKVHDGDTIRVSTTFRDFTFPIRFIGIDAKELNEGGEAAGDWLRAKILGQMVDVQIDKHNKVDKYGRLLGRVFYGGMDLGEEEMYLGLAMPFDRRYEGKLPDMNKEYDLSKWF